MNEPSPLEAIFFAALAKTAPPERAAYLDTACAGDTGLRRQVEKMLAAQAHAGSFLEQPAHGPALAVAERPLGLGPGAAIGAYKLLEQIGEGGFGIVFMAEQQQPVCRKVAVKVLKPGMDTRQVVARFEAERQALAIMDHPNIAHVFDGGATAEGRPYFVMELVKGVPITDYCDQHHLSVRARLELFVSVCHAVQHAHQKGIIHRDLKPSNILVTLHDGPPHPALSPAEGEGRVRGVPKIIDFGIAKATGQRLTDKTLFTSVAQMIGTPMYMSPEQAQLGGLDLDTRIDIYSLGVLLYELLSGTTPFDGARLRTADFDEVRRIIREEEPARPSARFSTLGTAAGTTAANRGTDARRLRQLCRGELDWIVMRCLDKDRNRRYETAGALAADVRHYLNDEPVQACPPSTWYRFGKAARRYKAALATAALTGTGLLAAVVVLAVSAARIAQEEQATSEALEREKQALVKEANALERERKANDVLTKALYRHRIALAHREWLAGDVARAERYLEACPAELRRWEWHYLKRLCSHEELTLATQAMPHSSVAVSPDGRCLAATYRDRTIRISDVTTGREIRSLPGHTREATAVAFSPDRRHLASAGRDGTVKVWDLQSGRDVHTFAGHKGGTAGVAYDPDGKRLASVGADYTLRIWDVLTGRQVLAARGHREPPTAVAYSPDGRRLVSATSGGEIKVWDTQTGQPLIDLRGGPAWTIAFGKAGTGTGLLVAAPGEDRSEVCIWDGATGKRIRALRGHGGIVFGLAVSSDGRLLASTSSDQTVKIWSLTTGKELDTLRGHDRASWMVAFGPDGQRLASVDQDGTIKVWNLATDRDARIFRWPRGQTATMAAFSPDSRCMALILEPADVRVWDLAANRELFRRGPLLWQRIYGISDNSRRLAWVAPDLTVVVCEVPSGLEVCRFVCPTPAGPPVLSPNGQRLALDGMDAVLRVWDVSTGQEVASIQHAKGPLCAAFSPGGRLVAFGHNAEGVRVRDLVTGLDVQAFPHPSSGVGPLRLSPDGERLAWTGPGNTVTVADLYGRRPPLILGGSVGTFQTLVFSPDGERLVTGSTDRAIRVWELETGQEMLTLRGHAHDFGNLAFSPDGYRLASTSRDQTLRIWDGTPLTARPSGAASPAVDAAR